MEEFGRRGFEEDGEEEPHLRSIVSRSNSSQHLLEFAPSSHCMVAAAIGEKPGVATQERAAGVAYHHEAEVMMSSRKKVLSPGVIADEHVKNSVWGFVGRLFHNTDSSVGVESRGGDASSQEGEEEHGKDGKKGKKKKRSSWLPDPDKRWPIQGFY